MPETSSSGTGRRAVLAAGLGSLGAAGLAGGVALAGRDQPGAASAQAAGAAGGDASAGSARVPFAGAHQQVITHDPVAARASMSAFRVTAQDRGELAELFEILTATIADLQAGRLPDSRDPSFPARETGILGAEVQPDHLGIAVSVGASLFDERFGLADRKPKNLAKMPFLANDRLDPQRSHGDLLLTIEADHPDTMQHALRQIMRAARAHMVMAWTIEGYSRGTGGGHGSGQTPRNLMGFKDGTNNLDMTDDRVMDEFVWVGADDGEPEWAVGGSYHVVRVIRMFVEFWDRTRIVEQEQIFGRHKVSGAPLGSEDEFAPINHSADPDGETIPLDSHIRLATPQTPDASGDVILRRGFSYTRGVDGSGQLDQGLAFVSFQRRLEQFLNIQARLDGEPLEEYILPEGGGFFFALPGVEDEGTSLGARLLA